MRISTHTLKLVYEADGSKDYLDGGLITSNSKKAIDGAQELVCAHAHYYATGRVPDNVMPQTADFLFKNPNTTGGHVKFTLEILRPGIWNASEYGFSKFLSQSYQAWEMGRLFDEPLVPRRQLSLRDQVSRNSPELTHENQLEQRSRLYRRVDRAISDLTKPIGISASSLQISWNGKTLATYKGRHSKFTEAEIAQAVLALKINPRIPGNFVPS